MSKPRKGLGRGLDALLPHVSQESDLAPEKSLADQEGLGIIQIPVDDIVASPFQPRTHFDPEALNELAKAVAAHGILQPILVRPLVEGGHELIAGERRLRAAKIAGLKKIPAISNAIEDKDAMALALIENVQREDLHPLERAISYQRLIAEHDYTHGELSELLGIARTSVTNTLRLLKLPKETRDLFLRGALDMGHARALTGLKVLGHQNAMARRIDQEGLSVRQVEDLVKKQNAQSGGKTGGGKGGSAEADTSPDTLRLEQKLGDYLGLPVQMRVGKSGGKGKLDVSFANHEQFEGLLERIGFKLSSEDD